jgi:UDP-N-acetylglucosamine--N-acetylmuramyl-(pentapeptide) pyrophosphoryl-undecaprenol N-acetylglucosamine transferase
MTDAGAAVVIEDSELRPSRLALAVDELFEDRARLEGMAAAARSLARPDAARRIADRVLEAAR